MKRFLIILFSTLLASCSGENTPAPETEPENMEDLICTDSPLLLELSSTPELGTAG